MFGTKYRKKFTSIGRIKTSKVKSFILMKTIDSPLLIMSLSNLNAMTYMHH